MNAEEKLLKVLSDQFEQATGRAVDMSGWSLDSLARVINHPNEVASLLGTFGSSRPAGVAAVEQLARHVVIGPPCRMPAKTIGFSNARLTHQGVTISGLDEGTYSTEIEIAEGQLNVLREQHGLQWPGINEQLLGYARDMARGNRLQLEPLPSHVPQLAPGTDLRDAMLFCYRSLAVSPPRIPAYLIEDLIAPVEHRAITALLEPLPDKRFNQRHAPKQPRNPFPVKAPWSKRR